MFVMQVESGILLLYVLFDYMINVFVLERKGMSKLVHGPYEVGIKDFIQVDREKVKGLNPFGVEFFDSKFVN